MRKQFLVSLSPTEARRLIGSVTDIIRRISVVDEMGSNYIAVIVPKGRRGTEKVRLVMDVFETPSSIAAIFRSDTDMMVVQISAVQQGLQTLITVVCEGVGRVARIIDTFGSELADIIRRRIESAYPSVEVNEEDNKLAALEKEPPVLTTLVYYDAFVPVFNITLESALRVISALGPDHYLVEVESLDEREPFTLRAVIRGNKITGLYAELPGQRLSGDDVLYANLPLARRVTVKAWALYGGRESVIYAPLEIASSGSHRVYWASVKGCAACGGLLSNTFMVFDGKEAVIVNPSGLEERHILNIEEVTEGIDKVKHVALTHIEADIVAGIDMFLRKNPRAYVYATPYQSSILNSAISHIGPNVKRVRLEVHEEAFGRIRLLVVPGAGLQPHNISLYDPVSKTLFTGTSLGAITPPGLWEPYVSDVEEYLKLVAPYLRHVASPSKLRAWINEVSRLDIEVLAPHHGPLVIGRQEARTIIEGLREIVETIPKHV
ncbi:hypothetical protein PYJP_11150 [Pyrofollis japonicus]|uniref:MBL fold metallo-hydrolase n=1 Tax=Pyrofollis japonicus TaxID=3060460 RepID=UPI00295A7EA8|nr:MBL fold metallo-hydrolase [Pyrofollis japonicus]BEP17763.1 hypothetical protein PYJP_11150 [Pyrofollis japonicus]